MLHSILKNKTEKKYKIQKSGQFRFSIDNFFVEKQLLQVRNLGYADFYIAMLRTPLKPNKFGFFFLKFILTKKKMQKTPTKQN